MPGQFAQQAFKAERGQRPHDYLVLFRDEPPRACFVVDEVALYRYVGSPETMAEQLGHLADVARLDTTADH